MADDNCANTSETTGGERAELRETSSCSSFGFFFGFFFGLGDMWELVADGGWDFVLNGLVKGVCGVLLGGCHCGPSFSVCI